jgi:hypothetical protein
VINRILWNERDKDIDAIVLHNATVHVEQILSPETPEWQVRLIELIEEALDRGEEIHLLYPWEYRR